MRLPALLASVLCLSLLALPLAAQQPAPTDKPATEKQATEKTPPLTGQAALDSLFDKLQETQNPIEARQLEALDRHFATIERPVEGQLEDLRALTQLEETKVFVTMQSGTPADAKISLSYMLPGATWETLHELRAAEGDPTSAEITSFAVVTQASGEDWNDAELTFSTQSSTTAVRIPELEALTLGDTSAVRSSLTLPVLGDHGSSITWASSDPSVMSTTSVVTRPASGSGDASVTLTATIARGNVTETRAFTVTVLERPDAPGLVAEDLAALTVVNVDDVRGNLTLPTSGANGTTFTWESSDPSVIDGTGVVHRPTHGQPTATVELTATGALESATAERTFTATVPALRPTTTLVDGQAYRVLRGRALELHGAVRDEDGEGLVGMRVDVFVVLGNGTERRLGATVTGAGGRFDASVTVPQDLTLGHHALRVRAAGDARHATSVAD